MRKRGNKLKRILALFLAVVMVVTIVPETGISALAAQENDLSAHQDAEEVIVEDGEKEESGLASLYDETTSVDVDKSTSTLEETYTVNFIICRGANVSEEVLSQVEIQDITGTTNLGTTVTAPEGENLSFHIALPEGYTVTGMVGYKPLMLKADYIKNDYTLSAKKNIYPEYCDLYIYISKIKESELYIEYPETIDSIEILQNENPAEFKDGKAVVSNVGKTVMKVHPAESCQVNAVFEEESGEEPEVLETTEIEADGTYCFDLGFVGENTSIVLSTGEAIQVSFDLGEDVSGYFWEDDTEQSLSGIRYYAPGKSLELWFEYNEEKARSHSLQVTSIVGEQETSEQVTYYSDSEQYRCAVTLTADTVIKVQWVAKDVYNVDFDIDITEGETVYQYSYYNDGGDVEHYFGDQYTDGKCVTVYAGERVAFAVLLDTSSRKVEYVSTTDSEEGTLTPLYTYSNDGAMIYYCYEFTPTEDTHIYIKTAPKKEYKVTFDIANAEVYQGIYDDYCDPYENGEEYTVYEGGKVRFQVYCEDIDEVPYKLSTLSTSEDGGVDLELQKYYDADGECYYYYYEVIPTEDTTIYVKAVPKVQYDVNFNVENAKICIDGYTELDAELPYTMYEGNLLFSVEADEGYKVEYVSTTGDETGIVGQRYDGEYAGYLYYLPVNSDTTVTVKTVSKEQYTVKFEGEHVSIEDVSGIIEQDSNDETGNTYTIYESGKLSFRIVTEEGYQLADVSATDEAGAAEQTLYPVENVTSGGSDCAVNIGQDTVIKIETTAKTPHTVKFETENASVQVIDGNYLESEDGYRAYEEDAFAFTVTAMTGYVIDTVTINGETEELEPIYDATDDIWYYELVPEKDTTISVSAKAAEDHTISFTCEEGITLEVWSEDSTAYTVTDGSVTVSSEAEVWFNATTTAGTIAKVVCKDGSGVESTILKTYDVGLKKSGYYIGNVKSDTEVTVSTGSTYRVEFTGIYSGEKIVPLDGKGIFNNVVVNVPDGEVFDFKIIPVDGYKITGIKAVGSIKLTGSKETGIYQAEQKNSGYLGESYVFVSSGLTSYAELNFNYPEEDVELEVYVGDEKLSLVDGKITLPKRLPFTVKIKPIADKLVEISDYSSEPDLIEEDGTMVYEISGGIASIGNAYFRVQTYDYNTVDFEMEHASILVYEYDSDEGYWMWKEADDSFKLKAGSELRFRFEVDKGYKISYVSTTEDESGKLSAQVMYNEDEYTYYNYYSITPTEDMNITVKTEVIPYNQIKFEYDSSLASLYIAEYTYYPEEDWYDIGWNEGSSVYQQYKSNTNDIWFRVVPAEGYRVDLVSTTEDKTGQVPQSYDDNTGYYYYYLPNTADATVTITVKPINSYELSFEYPTCIENISVRDEDWNYYEISEGKATVSNKGKIYIAPAMETGAYKISSVKANGVELQKIVDSDMGETYYVLDGFYENQKIVIETVVNEAYYNVIDLDVDGEQESYQAALKLYSDEDESEFLSSYKAPGDKLYVSGKTAKVVLQASEGYEITKVEFTRAGKTQTLTADETGVYKIVFPLSRTLSGSLKVYTVSTSDSKGDSDADSLSVAIEGVTDGKVSQTVDTAKEYKITFDQEGADTSLLGVEVVAADGTATDKVKAEIVDDALKLTTAVGEAAADAAVVKLYNAETSTTENKDYINGGTFSVTTVRPTALEEGTAAAALKRSDDISLTLTLTAPDGVEQSVVGRQYYKVVITPQEVTGKEIPAAIREATAKPYYVEKEAADSQNAKLLVSTESCGKGQAWKFDVTVSLVQTKDATALDSTTEGEAVIYKSKEGSLKDAATKDPCYEVKLTLKKQAKQIYTTQENVAAAQVVFSKDTCCTEIEEVKDITELNQKGSALQVWEEDGVIYASASADTMIGKHTIEATAYGPESMNKAKATVVVEVVKGIEQMEVSVPVNSLYKATGKATSLKATVSYNAGDVQAKTKKATWEIVNRDGEPFVKGDALYEMLTVKNGKVSVNKSFTPSETAADNQFRIKAKAADFEGNTTYALSEIVTLTNKAAEIGALYVVAPNADGYEVVAKEGSVITSDKLKNAFVVALNKDAKEKTAYTEAELAKWQLSPEILSYKTSNKAVAVEKTSEKVALSATKAAKNVKLTVSTNDGGKKKAVMKFTVAYAEPEALALEIADAKQTVLGEAGTKEVTFAGTTNTRLTVRVKQKTAEGWEALNALVNYKLTVKNGKIITADNVNGIYEIIVTGKTAQITLNNKTTGKTAKDVYTVTNTAYSEAKALKVKADGNLIAGTLENRKVTYTIKSAYDCKDKYVLAEIELTDRSKNADAYSQFEEAATNLNAWIPVNADGTFALTFAGTEIPVGSYKLKLTFGTGNTPESFVADAKPTAVTLKAAKPKATKGSFKAVTSYKIEAAPGAKVSLSGKGKNIVDNSVVFYDLKNANIKGTENQFLSYFELKDNTLYLKSDLKDEQLDELKSKAGKNNLTGYVSYTAAYGNDGYGNPYTVTKTVKITVKLK